jgi:type VI secretion system protein ImpH
MSELREGPARHRQRAHEEWLSAVAAAPHRADFYQALRRIASAHPELPPLGEAVRPRDEPLRVGQPPELDFAPAAVHAIERLEGRPLRLMQRVFGLLGPNGALPLHLTEYTRERVEHHGDRTLLRFLDMLTHRFAVLFYRAWADAQPTVNLDRPGSKTMLNRVGALAGIGLPSLQDRDAVSDASKLYFVGRLSRQTRDAEGLLAWCRIEFDVPVAIMQWCGHWMPLSERERTRLSRRGRSQLGRDAVLGANVWDVQHKFRICIGPLTLDQYRRFLPGGANLARLQAMVRHWVGLELDWDLRLVLSHDEAPLCLLGRGAAAMGYTSWLGCTRRIRDLDDLRLDVERAPGRRRARAGPTLVHGEPVRSRSSAPAVSITEGEPA